MGEIVKARKKERIGEIVKTRKKQRMRGKVKEGRIDEGKGRNCSINNDLHYGADFYTASFSAYSHTLSQYIYPLLK